MFCLRFCSVCWVRWNGTQMTQIRRITAHRVHAHSGEIPALASTHLEPDNCRDDALPKILQAWREVAGS